MRQTISTQKLDFVSDFLSELLNSLQNCSKLHLEGINSAFGNAHRGICRVILFSSNQKVDNFGVQPGGDGLEPFSIRVDALVVFTPGNDIDYIVESSSQSLRGGLIAGGNLEIVG